MYITQQEWIESLEKLRSELLQQKIPDETLQIAIAHNPWFTPYYIEKSIAGIISWFESEILTAFLQKYPAPTDTPRKIGIIAAGNVPCVGLQDIHMVLWSGNIAIVKLSHQDDILIPYLIEKWKKHLPSLSNRIFFVPKIEEVDFLIATGSNNTARYIQYHFDYLPKIIRKNRFSIAILTGNENPKQIKQLCEDIFLYNGMGCRNVSHIFSLTENIQALQEALSQYDKTKISKPYLQKIEYERAKYTLIPDKNILDWGLIFLKKIANPQYAPIGIVHICYFSHISEIQDTIKQYSHQIQCIVGENIAFGQAQNPAIDDFADGIDIWQSIIK